MSRNLQIIASTWDRDSYDLFDYESRLIIKNTMRLHSSAKLIRVGNDCTLWLDLMPKDTFSVLISIIEKNNQFYLVSEGPEKIWQVVKKMRTSDGEKGSILRQGDIIKLGKIILRVKEICIPNSNIVNEGDQCYKLEENNLNFQVTCRICLGDGHTKENPLISPCKCSGTMKYLHLECLQKWLRSKVSSRITECSRSYYWNEFECELCKQGFPSKIKLDGKIINLLEFQKPETPYIILQDLRGEIMRLNGIHIISLSKNSLKIGRGHNSDIRIPDSSISKIHAELKLTKNGVLLSDSSSKFGTLIQVKKFMLVPHQKTLSGKIKCSSGRKNIYSILHC